MEKVQVGTEILRVFVKKKPQIYQEIMAGQVGKKKMGGPPAGPRAGGKHSRWNVKFYMENHANFPYTPGGMTVTMGGKGLCGETPD